MATLLTRYVIGLFSVPLFDSLTIQQLAKMHLTLSVAIMQNGAHAATTPIIKKAAASGLLRPPMSSRKASNKHSCFDSSLKSASTEQSQLAKLAKGLHDYRMEQLKMKHQKMELQIEKERATQQLASQEYTLAMKQQMQEMLRTCVGS